MAEILGEMFLCVGGALLAIFVLSLLGQVAVIAWIAASNKWRNILKAESLIYEYRKNRKEYLLWREQKQKDGAK